MSRQVVIGMFAFLTVALSFFAEFGLGKPVCSLCWMQRILWACVGVSAILWYFKSALKRCCQILLVCIFLLASYHSLVQLKLIEDRCKITHNVEDVSSYKTMIM